MGVAACADEVDTEIVWISQCAAAGDVFVDWREREPGEEIGVGVVTSAAICEAKVMS